MATQSHLTARVHTPIVELYARRMHFCVLFALFFGLGLNVGIWATLLADLSNALTLRPDTLGFALTSFSCAGIVLLALGGYLADHVHRRLLVLIGVGGIGIFFFALANVSSFTALLVTLLFAGACASCYDLAANTLGGDYERSYATRIMTQLHAGFSGGAAFGALGSALALASGIEFRTIYASVGAAFLLFTLAMTRLPLPPRETNSLMLTPEGAADATSQGPHSGQRLLTPLVIVSTLLVCCSFFTDGALEGYTSVYLRNALGSGALLSGLGIALFYLIGMLGRLGSTGMLRRFGERRVVTVAGTLSTVGMALALVTAHPLLVVCGLCVVGLGQSPIVPTAFSLAARTRFRSARAVAFVTTCGYTVFLIGPLLIGVLASLASIRTALLLTIATSVGVVLVAQRIPAPRTARPDPSGEPERAK